MATNKYIVNDNEGNKYTLHQKQEGKTNIVYYEVYRYTEDEICGEYIDDFECDAQIGTDDFLSDFNAWLNEEITALF